MIIPKTKLATARGFHEKTFSNSLGKVLNLEPTFRTSQCSIKKIQSLSILRSQLGKNIEDFYSKL